MSLKDKRLRIMAGPNGSGKTTILQEVRKNFYSGPFVNADEIEALLNEHKRIDLAKSYDISVGKKDFDKYLSNFGKSWLKKAKTTNTKIHIVAQESAISINGKPSPYDAALVADFIRHQLLIKNQTFTFETVLSHPSKIEFLQESLEAGFKNYLYFICTIDPAINIERVKQLVSLGGHFVPEDRIIKRYMQSLELLPSVIPLCHRAYLFDNSSEERSLEPVAEIDVRKKLTIKSQKVPWWIQQYVIDKLYKSKEL